MPKIKICGITTLEEVAMLNAYLPDYAGFVFAPTRRFVTDEQAKHMRIALDDRIQTVGVFVNEPIAHIAALCQEQIIDVIQLHGDESKEYMEELRQQIHVPIIRAVRVQSSKQVREMLTGVSDFLLFDTYKKDMYGGSGERFSLSVLQEGLKGVEEIKPFFLAGGLTPDNIEEVLRTQGCYCVDVSSGVETDGHKDEEKVKALIEKVTSFGEQSTDVYDKSQNRR